MAQKPTYEELRKRVSTLKKSESRRKRVEKALKESEAYLRTLIRTIPELVWMKDPEGIYLFCNARFERFFGAKEEDIVGKTDYDFVDKALAELFRENDKLAIEKGAPHKNEEEVTYADDGHQEIVETIKTPIYLKDGRLAGVLGIGRDITGYKQAEMERLANLHFFESLDRVNRIIQGTSDLKQVLLDVLEELLSIFECDRAFLLYALDPEDASWEIPLERTRPKYPGAYEFSQRNRRGITPEIIELRKRLLTDNDPVELKLGEDIDPEQEPWKRFQIKSVLTIAIHPKIGNPWQLGMHQCSHARLWTPQEKKLFQEISRRLADGLTSMLLYENLEQMVEDRTAQLKAAQDELVKKEKLAVLGQLTATVSHELRNPLGVIRTSNYYLESKIKGQDEKLDKHIRRIEEQVSLCDIIVADLLEYTRGRDIVMTKGDMSAWLTEAVEQVAEHEKITISIKIKKKLPPVLYDREKMRRVIINILTNSIQAVKAKSDTTAEKGGKPFTPRISLEARTNGGNLDIIISDNGIGMDKETREQAFEPLFTTRTRGTGLGLAIVKKIIEEHNGVITLESRQGKGTSVILTLPVDL